MVRPRGRPRTRNAPLEEAIATQDAEKGIISGDFSRTPITVNSLINDAILSKSRKKTFKSVIGSIRKDEQALFEDLEPNFEPPISAQCTFSGLAVIRHSDIVSDAVGTVCVNDKIVEGTVNGDGMDSVQGPSVSPSQTQAIGLIAESGKVGGGAKNVLIVQQHSDLPALPQTYKHTEGNVLGDLGIGARNGQNASRCSDMSVMNPSNHPSHGVNCCGTVNADGIINDTTTNTTMSGQNVKTMRWNSVAKAQAGMSLHFCKNSALSSEVDICQEDFEGEIRVWQHTLMGNFLGAKPTLEQVQAFVSKNWNHVAGPIVQYFRRGWFSFRFTNSNDMEEVLKGGPWTMGSNTVVLKQWTPSFTKDMDRVSTVPIWILFPDLDPLLWSDTVLSKLASKIGKPLYADMTTTTKARLSFARVLMEADLATDLPENIILNTPFHGQINQKVVYEWKPYYCTGCRKMGHTVQFCNHKAKSMQNSANPLPQRTEWIPKIPTPACGYATQPTPIPAKPPKAAASPKQKGRYTAAAAPDGRTPMTINLSNSFATLDDRGHTFEDNVFDSLSQTYGSPSLVCNAPANVEKQNIKGSKLISHYIATDELNIVQESSKTCLAINDEGEVTQVIAMEESLVPSEGYEPRPPDIIEGNLDEGTKT